MQTMKQAAKVAHRTTQDAEGIAQAFAKADHWAAQAEGEFFSVDGFVSAQGTKDAHGAMWLGYKSNT